MATQQDIIKKFMKSLDDAKNWTASGAGGIGGAINAAIKDASEGTSGDNKFKSLGALSEAFLDDLRKAPDVDTFLREKCGIIIDNEDTGSVTGFDMGGTKIKTEESIVPEVDEVIRLDNEYREQQIANPNQETFELDGDNVTVDANGTLSFTKKGLTVKFYDYDELIEAANSTDETTRSEAENKLVVINGLYTWWIEGALKLIAESYGDNYGFDDKSDAKVREIKLELEFKEADRRNAYVNYNVLRAGLLLPQTLWINMAHFVGIDSSNFNGKISSEFSSVEYLDSDIAHELTHAVMNANIDKHAPGTTLLGEFPILLKDGMAELTRGIDNYRKDYIIGGIAEYKNSSDPDSTDFGIVMNNLLKSNYYQDDRAYYQYVGGYMLMHYLAKQCADEEFSGINVRTTENQTETALMLTGQRFTANNGTALVSAGDKIKTDENNNITEITIGKSDNIISTPESKTPVIVKNRKGEVLAS
ncbi:MAG: hypothetical protein IKP64_01455, partial [Selenomonadaceae bacterium]|nr:hypothetical protein [Selenomonadaceae bacterium]